MEPTPIESAQAFFVDIAQHASVCFAQMTLVILGRMEETVELVGIQEHWHLIMWLTIMVVMLGTYALARGIAMSFIRAARIVGRWVADSIRKVWRERRMRRTVESHIPVEMPAEAPEVVEEPQVIFVFLVPTANEEFEAYGPIEDAEVVEEDAEEIPAVH